MTVPLTDAELVARCRAGDESAWAELVERFSRYVYAIAMQGFRLSEHDAEDVFQEVFARTYERLDALRDDAAVKPWLAQLTRNLCVDRLGRQRARRADGGRRAPAWTTRSPSSISRSPCATRCRRSAIPARDLLDRFFCRDESYRTIGEAARSPVRNDRQPHLALPREAPRATRGKKRRPRPVWRSMSENAWNEEHLGELLGLLRPAPGAGSTPQPELPRLRAVLDDLVERAEADAAFRSVLIADLEAALAREGVQPTPRLVRELAGSA